MRSDTIKRGFDRAPHRSLLRATGQIASAGDFDKPFVAVCNSYVDIIPPAPTPHTGWLAPLRRDGQQRQRGRSPRRAAVAQR